VNDRVVPAVRRIAADRNIPLIDVNAHMTGHPEWFAEAVHPNLAGYKQIADVVYASIIGARIAVEPSLDASNRQTAIEFDSTLPGTTSTRRFTISNPGNEPLMLTGTPAFTFSGMASADFTVLTPPKSPIAPGEATTVDVSFMPATFGDRYCTMTIRSSEAAQAVVTIPLHGTGSATTHSFTNALTESSNWAYLKGTKEASVPSEAWRMHAFSVANWPRAAMPFWYGDGKGGTLLPDMVGSYGSVYVRQDVIVGDTNSLTELILSVDYDDAYAVWVNGNLLRSVGAPEPALHNAITTNNHECSVSPAVERGDVDLSRHPASAYLVQGTNTIGAMVFNRGLNSSDCHLNLNLSVVSNRGDFPAVGASRREDRRQEQTQ
jgi:hypothetical protein